MKCQMSWSVKCHEVSKVFKCQTSPNGKCHQISNVKCNQMSNIVKFLMSVEVALCSGPCRVPLQWPPAAAPDYSREISQRLSTQCLSNLFKCHPSFLSKQSFYRLTDRSNPRCYIHLRWSCFSRMASVFCLFVFWQFYFQNPFSSDAFATDLSAGEVVAMSIRSPSDEKNLSITNMSPPI